MANAPEMSLLAETSSYVSLELNWVGKHPIDSVPNRGCK